MGGGLTGLTLAYLLKSKGLSYQIIEMCPTCGGLLKSLKIEGFTFDTGGSHIIFSKDDQVLNFIFDLLKNNLVKNKRNTKILYNGKYIKYPFENGLHDLQKIEIYECLHSFIDNIMKKNNGELSAPSNLREWFFYAFGNAIVEKYMIPYNEKVWKYPLDCISLEWVERIPMPTLDEVVKSSLGIETEGYVHQLNFYYPQCGGIEALISAMEMNTKDDIVTNFRISKIIKCEEGWVVSDGYNEIIYDKIISTIPIMDLVAAIGCPEEIVRAASQLKFNSLITVMLGVDLDRLNEYSWLYIPHRDVIFNRISFPKNFSKYVTPTGKSSVLVEITCNYLDDTWTMEDDELMNLVISQLEDLAIIDASKICFKQLSRTKYAYVIYDLSYKKNVQILQKYFEELGIDLVGRFSEFKYINMDGCIRNAIDYVDSRCIHD